MDFVKISYTGRVKDGRVFDTTNAEIAKKEGIFDDKRLYAPIPVVVGERNVIEGLDEALAGMKPGEEKLVEVNPEKAYGKRDSSLIRLVPLKLFKKEGMTPIPGMPVELDGKMARVQTVAGGRVRVDFNHELADKTLVYEVKVEETAKGDTERTKFLIERSFNNSEGFGIKVTKKDKVGEIVVPEDAYKDKNLLVRKASLFAELSRFMKLETVTFKEVWSMGKPEEKKKKAAKKKK